MRFLILVDLKDMKFEYIFNIVVNCWKNNDKDKINYILLIMLFLGIQCFDQCGKGQFKGKLELEDIMLLEVMVIFVVVFFKYMGKYEEFIEGLICFYIIFGFEMGFIKISDLGY